jgi:hypothetical protein
MTLPWDTATPAVPLPAAEDMQPDLPIPAADPYLPAVAVNPTTGLAIGVDLAPQLQAAIQTAITAAVSAHPILGKTVTTVVRDRERPDRTIMQGSLFDAAVVILAALVTIVSPDSPVGDGLWIAAAALAGRTLIQGAIYHARPEAAP